jgi:hypothetical protein
MPSLDDIAGVLFGTRRIEGNAGGAHVGETKTIYAKATSDSEGGYVTVDMGGDVTRPTDAEDDGIGSEVELPTTTSVRDGDDVIVTLVGDDVAKVPTVTGVVGNGDQVNDDILSVRDGAVAGTSEEYTLSQDRTKPPGSGARWSPLVPECPPGSFVWRRSVTTYGDGSTIRGEPVRLSGDDAATVEVVSDRGFSIRNNHGSVTLSAQVVYGGERITDTGTLHAYFGQGSSIRWVRVEDGVDVAIPDGDARLSADGWSLTVGADDVNLQASYAAQLMTA